MNNTAGVQEATINNECKLQYVKYLLILADPLQAWTERQHDALEG